MTTDILDAARGGRRRLLVALVATLVLGAGFLAVGLRSTGSTESGRVAVPATSTPGEPPVSTDAMSVDLSWTTVAGVALPLSLTAGPQEADNGRARGFANSWTGVVLAAVHLLVRTTAEAGPAVFEPTLAEQVVGLDAETMRQKVRQQYEQQREEAGVPYGQPVGRLTAELAGFRIESFTYASDAVVSVLTKAEDRAGVVRYAVTTVNLRWIDEDWALVAPAGGSWDSSVLVVDADRVATFSPLQQGR